MTKHIATNLYISTETIPRALVRRQPRDWVTSIRANLMGYKDRKGEKTLSAGHASIHIVPLLFDETIPATADMVCDATAYPNNSMYSYLGGIANTLFGGDGRDGRQLVEAVREITRLKAGQTGRFAILDDIFLQLTFRNQDLEILSAIHLITQFASDCDFVVIEATEYGLGASEIKRSMQYWSRLGFQSIPDKPAAHMILPLNKGLPAVSDFLE